MNYQVYGPVSGTVYAIFDTYMKAACFAANYDLEVSSTSDATNDSLEVLESTPPQNPTTMEPILLIEGSHGIYIPQIFAQRYSHLYATDYTDLLEGPDNLMYWKSWGYIVDNAEIMVDGVLCRLVEDGDLWLMAN